MSADSIAIDIPIQPIPDAPTVTPEGERLERRVEGVEVRTAVTHLDERGSLTEVFNPAWGFTEDPLVYVYQATIRPGQKKGWVVHHEQDDRLFFDNGAIKVAFYDARTESPTFGLVNVLFFGSANRALVRIPPGVFHGLVNIGAEEARFVNLPTRAYRHDRPDKSRLPADTSAIPYTL